MRGESLVGVHMYLPVISLALLDLCLQFIMAQLLREREKERRERGSLKN